MAVSKRVQVLLRDRIADIVEGLAECEGISVSRVCGALIEEALKAKGPLTLDGQLHARGGAQEVSPEELGLDSRKIAPTQAGNKPIDQFLEATQQTREEAGMKSELVTENNRTKRPTDDLDDDDLKLLRKLKMLKELNLL